MQDKHYRVCPIPLTAVGRFAYCDHTRSNHPALWFITWNPSQPVATRPPAIRKDGNWFAYGWDLTKNACEVYGPSGYIRTSYTYTPFGHVASNGDVKQPLQWSSEFYDDSIDLVYYTFRYYNSNSANWISRDPVIAKRKETGYLFTRNNPISQYDYLGLLFGFITDFFSQNQPTPPQNTRPQKVQPNTKKEGCTNAGLAEAENKDKASCEKHVLPQNKIEPKGVDASK